MTHALTPEQQKLLDHARACDAEYRRTMQELADSCCPYKVGDTMVSKNGYHARITKIQSSFLQPFYRVMGSIIRTNGTLASDNFELSEVFGVWKPLPKETP